MENEKLQEQTESMADYEAHFDDANPWNVVARYQEEGTNLHVKVEGIVNGGVRVIEANQAEGRLILSAREILREQKKAEDAKKLASVQVGSVVKGTVESLQSYGAFVRLENGLSGLVHISQISTQRIKSADQVLHVGDEVDVKVIGIKDGKISLSIKALAEDAEKEQEEELEHVEIPKVEAIGTSLGDLFKNIKL